MADLVTLTDPRSPVAEAYRALRTNLAFARPDEPVRSLMVAAPSAAEDRPVALANLAVVTAQADRRVIVVDCDLRRPSQHVLFGLPNETGVTSVLVADDGLEALPLQATAVAGLHVLTSGPIPPNPAELLGTRRMKALVAALLERAELVLFDAPPLVAVTDGAVLAPLLDGVLLVLRAGRSRRDETLRAREVLHTVGARLLGVVLTDAPAETSAYGAYGASGGQTA